MKSMEDLILPLCPVTVNRTVINGARTIEVTASTITARHHQRVLIDLHGGAFVCGEGMVLEAAVAAAHSGQIKMVAVITAFPLTIAFQPIWKTRQRLTVRCLNATFRGTSRCSALRQRARMRQRPCSRCASSGSRYQQRQVRLRSE